MRQRKSPLEETWDNLWGLKIDEVNFGEWCSLKIYNFDEGGGHLWEIREQVYAEYMGWTD